MKILFYQNGLLEPRGFLCGNLKESVKKRFPALVDQKGDLVFNLKTKKSFKGEFLPYIKKQVGKTHFPN